MAMNAEQLRAALSLLLDEMEGEIEDPHEVYLRLTMLLGVPDAGPLIARTPIAAQKRLPTSTTARPCQTLSPKTMSSPPRTTYR